MEILHHIAFNRLNYYLLNTYTLQTTTHHHRLSSQRAESIAYYGSIISLELMTLQINIIKVGRLARDFIIVSAGLIVVFLARHRPRLRFQIAVVE